MHYYLAVTPERESKTRMIMEALAAGFGGEPHRVVLGEPPEDDNPFVVWGQEWLALRIIPRAIERRRPFWHIDNGFWQPARGTSRGYYRLTYRSMTPVLLPDTGDLRLAAVPLRPWRQNGRHILIAMPGVHFGLALGIDVRGWCNRIEAEVRSAATQVGREVRIRPRDSRVPLATDFRDCWAVVTHSSNVAVDAVIAGIPVFVQPTSPAAPVGRTDLDLAEPITPGRKLWSRSLASQQFTLPEMRDGTAQRWMRRIAEWVDGMKVKLQAKQPIGRQRPGDVFEVTRTEARVLIALGKAAEYVEPPRRGRPPRAAATSAPADATSPVAEPMVAAASPDEPQPVAASRFYRRRDMAAEEE